MKLISDTAEYALRAIVWLIQEPSSAQTTRQIAEGTRTPPDYIQKVLQSLSRSGLVTSRRGPGGGFLLAADPQTVSVLDVVNAVDPLQRIHRCPLELEAHSTCLCPLHAGINHAVEHIEQVLGGTKLATLLEATEGSIPLGIDLSRSRAPVSPAPRLRRKRGCRKPKL